MSCEQVIPDTMCYVLSEACSSVYRLDCPKSSHCFVGMLRCASSTEILDSVTQTEDAGKMLAAQDCDALRAEVLLWREHGW